ncbi:hypothetical protein K1719_025247 [Acacia pycnantha]|nr:hypothetical protein K1719_025247 [Acacia pycnantha]
MNKCSIISFVSGGIFGSLMPNEKYFAKALYTFDIGQNDLGSAIYANKTLQEIDASIPDIIFLLLQSHVDIYSAKYSLISNANKYGFEKPTVSCCGHGGEYNYNSNVQCGRVGVVNGTEIFGGSCENPSVRVNWDGLHYTEAANKFLFDQISTRAFSDPPIPLNMACHRHFSNMFHN